MQRTSFASETPLIITTAMGEVVAPIAAKPATVNTSTAMPITVAISTLLGTVLREPGWMGQAARALLPNTPATMTSDGRVVPLRSQCISTAAATAAVGNRVAMGKIVFAIRAKPAMVDASTVVPFALTTAAIVRAAILCHKIGVIQATTSVGRCSWCHRGWREGGAEHSTS